MKQTPFLSWFTPSLALLLASVPQFLHSAHSATPVTAGLVAYYPFDGDTRDLSGSANHGVVHNAGFEANGIRGSSCLRCDGTASTYVRVPRSDSLEPQDAMSISLWVKGAHGEQFGTLLRKAGNMESGYFIRRRTPEYTDQRARFETSWPTSDTPYPDLPTNQWTHLVVTFSREVGVVSVFLNGQLANTTALTQPLQHTSDLYIGGAAVHWMDGGFNGLIDELAIYNRALTVAEVAALNAWGTDSLVPDIAWWRMENRYTGRIEDATGKGHTAAIVGAPAFGYAPEIGQPFIHFDGESLLRVEDSDDLDLTGDWTMMFWTKPIIPGTGGYNMCVSKARSMNDQDGGYAVNSVVDSEQIRVTIYKANFDNWNVDAGPVSKGQWNHIAAMFDSRSQTVQVFLNGTLAVSSGTLGPVKANGYPLFLGAGLSSDGQTPENMSRNALADVRVYGRRLSAEAIRMLHEQTAGPFIAVVPAVVWETTGTDGYMLEGSANPGGPWNLVTSSQYTVGSRVLVVPEPLGSLQFFRLRKP